MKALIVVSLLALSITAQAQDRKLLPGQIDFSNRGLHQPERFRHEPYQVKKTSPWGLTPSHEYIERDKRPADLFQIESKQDLHSHSSNCLFTMDGCD